MHQALWILLAGALGSACGGSVISHESGDGRGGQSGAPSSGGYAGSAIGNGGFGGTDNAAGASSGLEDCGPDQGLVAKLPLSNALDCRASSAALTSTTLYLGCKEANYQPGRDRIYAMPRCGHAPQLIASELSLFNSSLSANAEAAFAVNAGEVGEQNGASSDEFVGGRRHG